ncbi:glycogen debranching protein GlgX [Planktothrix sp. FACHB-1355]|uniref:Glycogen debranching protein GlgX n=1 Tax=Aerosakkonema funiforme FACHB-1375 TaxID=2949571 RepID=A0A926ZGG1_9CYAN|nr:MULTISPECIES: glycogen debranching protein GlgX [Oscillatoriales]MBD2179766.1 glycogen debranching protein GlgX [Aerosakkonema funiforme FACHB-1375]MBD3559356.1 glycogen debranching protein GlgX [Planktothrix sp. FACHB-1355]
MDYGRIDIHPTHTYGDFKLRRGRPSPFGATLVPGGVNFSIFSSYAKSCILVLFQKHAKEPMAEIPFPDEFRIGNVFSMIVFDLDYENIEYGYRMDGPFNPKEGHWFDSSKILMDPYAKLIGGRDVWGETPDWSDIYHHRARIALDDFDWGDDRPLEIPPEDLVIYEMHVRSFTKHPSSQVKHPGTFAGIKDKIPYIKELGVNAIELMPVYEFDEFENSRPNPVRPGETLLNYWGYSTVGFFAPKAGYAATGKLGMQVDELKTLVKELHKNGMEVILDVVFNHTAEGNEYGPYISFRGIDNKTYYMLTPDGYYYNFSGCGNTLNCNNPIVRNIVLDCLRYWASEYHIDGFRFDLASILGRDPRGFPLPNPPLLETLAFDPILAKCKLIAEAWDAGGLYQVGSFPAFGRWAEWNGKYRDTARKFLKGDASAGEMAPRLTGSPDLYAWEGRGPATSINFITAHDGFTLMDMVSYNYKHNEANGENNNDGSNDNDSWNCGWEGPTDDPGINALRKRQVKNAVAMLMVSTGVPMILMGDEVGRTQYGNNNTYCHDNELNWQDWTLLEKNADLFRFFKNCIAFRHAHPVLRSKYHFSNRDYMGSGYADITWHGTQAWNADWSGRALAFMLCGKHAKAGTVEDNYVYVAMNMHWEALWFGIPGLPDGMKWHVFANTGAPTPDDIWEPGFEPMLENQSGLLLGSRSVLILVGK